MPVVHQQVGDDEIRTALAAILASESFSRSPQLSRLLKFLCTCHLEQTGDRISEHTIGAEVLGRGSNFDPAQDAAVRVEMHRLRRRLRDYYLAEGAGDPIRIQIPTGRYAPMFVPAQDEDGPAPVERSETIGSLDDRPPILDVDDAALATPSPSVKARIPWFYLAPALLVIAALTAMFYPRSPATANARVARPESLRSFVGLPAAAPGAGYRISCGRRRDWTDRLGQVWSADQHFTGGQELELESRTYVAGTFDPHLFESARIGNFHYRIPLPARTYELRLYFIEPVFRPDVDPGGEGNRVFNVSINGQRVLNRFDIFSDSGGPWIADVRVFKDIAPGPDGFVRLDFQNVTGVPLVNAIEFVPARPHILNPIRILPQDSYYNDSAGNLWTPDNYSIGGRISIHAGPVRNTRDQDIFRHERFGHFRYAIPVAPGNYSLYLYLAELYYGPGNPGGGGPNTRVFDVFCNGYTLIRDLDLFKEVGSNYAVVRAFHHLTPNAQGKLDISFVPERDYASVYALEVLDEAGPDSPSADRTVESHR